MRYQGTQFDAFVASELYERNPLLFQQTSYNVKTYSVQLSA